MQIAATMQTQDLSARQAGSEVAGQLPSLTGLRWVAAFLVFGYHVQIVGYFHSGLGQNLITALFASGSVGVSFFFILSGFVLMWSTPRSPARRFWRRRFARVYPLHLATALAAGVFLLLHAPHDLPTPAEALANLALVHAWFPDTSFYQSLNTVSWTLSCEAFFYLMFPLLCRAVIRLRALGAAVLASSVLLVTIAGPLVGGLFASRQTPAWVFHWFPLGRLPEFVLGVALAHLVRLTHTHLQQYSTRLWNGAVVLTVVGYVAAFANSPLRYASCTAAGFALLLVAASVSDLRGDRLVFQRPTFVKLGEISFAFYLVHLLVVRVLETIIGYHPKLPDPAAIGLTLLTFSVSLLLAWMLHEGIEKPGRRWLLRYSAASSVSGRAINRRPSSRKPRAR